MPLTVTVPDRFRYSWEEVIKMDLRAMGCPEDMIRFHCLQWTSVIMVQKITSHNQNLCQRVSTVIAILQHSADSVSQPFILRIKTKQGTIKWWNFWLISRRRCSIKISTVTSNPECFSRFPILPRNARIVPKFRPCIFLLNHFQFGLWDAW